MNSSPHAAPTIVAKIVLEPGAGEISQKAQDTLLCADTVHIEINALNASPDTFPPDTLGFLLRNADRIFGMFDCGPAGDAAYWEELIDGMTFPKVESGRWTVRLIARDAAAWGARIDRTGYLGPFEFSGPFETEDTAAA